MHLSVDLPTTSARATFAMLRFNSVNSVLTKIAVKTKQDHYNQRITTWLGSFAILTRITAVFAVCALLGLGVNSVTRSGTGHLERWAPIAGDTDVATVGTTVFAYYWNGGPRTVNGVSFTGPGAGITVSSPIGGPYTDYARDLTGLSADYTARCCGGNISKRQFHHHLERTHGWQRLPGPDLG